MAERPLLIAIIAAGAAISAPLVGAWWNGHLAVEAQAEQSRGQLALQREQFRAQLILKAIDTQSQDDRIRNLQFLLKAGLLQDADGRIAGLVAGKDRSAIPFISSRANAAADLADCVRPRSEDEWRTFQRRNKLPVTGAEDEPTQKAIVAMETRCKTPYKPSMDFSDPRNSQNLPAL
ncbi:MAG: hypothetical protein ACHP9T_08460 [Caulobacterales bacterium]